ncbi:MAG: threonine ammonia-lyase, biosynthetic, partial [Acidobacteria bacterium]|nr:threonine ammonia-lyase, biosynthetic [Acidobacteriota bacterium]
AKNITEFNYRIADSNDAHVFVGIEVDGRSQTARIVRNLERHGLTTLDLSDNEMAKWHVRHMVGGRAPFAKNEFLYRFEFPERPGALLQFLDTLGGRWNISLFHYRNHGSDFGRVLAAMEVPPDEDGEFERFLNLVGYRFQMEDGNDAYRRFLEPSAEA